MKLTNRTRQAFGSGNLRVSDTLAAKAAGMLDCDASPREGVWRGDTRRRSPSDDPEGVAGDIVGDLSTEIGSLMMAMPTAARLRSFLPCPNAARNQTPVPAFRPCWAKPHAKAAAPSAIVAPTPSAPCPSSPPACGNDGRSNRRIDRHGRETRRARDAACAHAAGQTVPCIHCTRVTTGWGRRHRTGRRPASADVCAYLFATRRTGAWQTAR